MRSFFVPCHVCGSFDREELFPSTYRDKSTVVQTIGICRSCGLLYRNPLVPELCAPQYSKPSEWGADHIPTAFAERFAFLTGEIAARVSLGSGELYMDVGAGPGWLAGAMHQAFPNALPVLLEPAIEVAVYTKTHNPHAVVVPSVLGESDLPSNTFSLIMVCGVDYLFHHHRKDLEMLLGLLRDGGVLYIERNVFIDQRAYFRYPILDMDDLCGSNAQMNTWFSRAQFAEYLSEFFEVFDTVSYVSGDSPAPYEDRLNEITGFFCRKRPAGARESPRIVNRFAEHVKMLDALARESSLEDLRGLAAAGVRTVIISGRGPEARCLAQLIRENQLFSIAGFVEPGTPSPINDPLTAEFATPDPSAMLDAFLLASIADQERHLAFLQQAGHGDRALLCFRPGLQTFTSPGGSQVQLKAFLPNLLRRSGTAIPQSWGIASAPR